MTAAMRASYFAIALAILTLATLCPTKYADAQTGAIASPSPHRSDPCAGPSRLLATANRPTIGFSTCAVKKGTAVFELGYQNEVQGTSSVGSIQSQVPQNFLRLGVASRFELDVIGPNYEGIRTYATGMRDTIITG